MKKLTATLFGAVAGAALTISLAGVVEASAGSTGTAAPSPPGLAGVVGVVVPAAGESCGLPGARDSYTCTTNDGTGHETVSYTCTVPVPGETSPVYRCAGTSAAGEEVAVSVGSDCTASSTFYARFGASTCDNSAKVAMKAAVAAVTGSAGRASAATAG